MLNKNFVIIYIYMYIIYIIRNTNLIYVDSEICSTEKIYIYIYKISTNFGLQERQGM